MNQRVKAIVEEARQLTRQERLELFDQLEIVFAGDEGDGTPEEIEAAWMELAEQRMAKADRGEATFVDFEVTMAELKARLRLP